MKYLLKEGLPEISSQYVNEEAVTVNGEVACQTVSPLTIHIVKSKESINLLEKLGIVYEGELNLSEICFSKAEAEQDYFYGTLAVPKSIDILESRFRVIFLINKRNIVFINDDGYVKNIINRLRRKKIRQNETREKFLSLFFSEIISRDAVLLDEYEHKLMEMEEEALHKQPEDFYTRMIDVRKKLLTLRSYYEQIAELGKILEENENAIFTKKQLKYFGTVSDRAERLFQRTLHLIDYANQVKDVYQGQVDAKQNRNMQYLTVVSTIFFPLTLITGWFGMNFENMPELKDGYTTVKIVSVVVFAICIFIFKKKKML